MLCSLFVAFRRNIATRRIESGVRTDLKHGQFFRLWQRGGWPVMAKVLDFDNSRRRGRLGMFDTVSHLHLTKPPQ